MSFTNINGADISYYQGNVDFSKFLAYGFKFVVLRCGYAVTKDLKFDANMAGLAGKIPLSVYHYYYPMYNARDQANAVLQTLAPYKQTIRRVWLDLEFVETGAYQNPEHWLTYRNTIESAGYLTGIYTRASWWDSRVGIYAGEFAKRPVWAAQYNSVLTLIPKGWQKAMLWQKGTPVIGKAAGVVTLELDFDVWNDDFDFVAEWGSSPQNGETGMTFYGRNKSTLTNIRNGPAGTYTDIGDLLLGDLVEADKKDATGVWWHLTKITRNGANVTLPGVESWAWGVNIEELPAPPPPVEDTIDISINGVKKYSISGKLTQL